MQESHPEIKVNPELSIVIPMYNEAEVIGSTIDRLNSVISGLSTTTEIVLVNDGSTDGTSDAVKISNSKSAKIRLINLRQNVGHMDALTIGMKEAKGDFVVTLDADLQDPPELIPEMLRILKLGHVDVVQMSRPDRSTDSWFKRQSATWFYIFLKKITKIDPIPHAADFRMVTRETNVLLANLPERRRVYRFLVRSLGLRIVVLHFARPKRELGKTKYPLRKMLAFAFDSIISFSNGPLRVVFMAGILGSVLMLTLAIATLGIWVYGKAIPGWTSLVFLILATNALSFAAIGLVGEYVGRIYEQVQMRPITRYDVEDLP